MKITITPAKPRNPLVAAAHRRLARLARERFVEGACAGLPGVMPPEPAFIGQTIFRPLESEPFLKAVSHAQDRDAQQPAP